jgi:hypothetical protein
MAARQQHVLAAVFTQPPHLCRSRAPCQRLRFRFVGREHRGQRQQRRQRLHGIIARQQIAMAAGQHGSSTTGSCG